MRVTSGMVRRNYQSNLLSAQERLHAANMTSTNYKKFQRVSENTAGASKAFQVRRELSRALTFEETAKDLQGRLNTAEDCIMNIETKLTNAYEKVVSAANGTWSEEERDIFAEELRGLQKAILQDMNTSYAGQYMFGGAATGKSPLDVDEHGKLTYRGFTVDGPKAPVEPIRPTEPIEPTAPGNPGDAWWDAMSPEQQQEYTEKYTEAKKQYDEVDKPNYDAAKAQYDIDKPVYDAAKQVYDKEKEEFDKNMEALANESVLIDLGYGINTDNEQSGFDISLPALDFLGYGIDEETGMSNNLYNLIGEMAGYLENAGEDFDSAKFGKYMDQFEKTRDSYLTKMTNMGNKSETINYTLTRLSTTIVSLQEKQSYVESVDPAKALTDWQWEQFAYRSALAIGTKVLQPTLLDYLN